MRTIKITLGPVALTAELLDTPTAESLYTILPLQSSARTWGDEVYFPAPAEPALEAEARLLGGRAMHSHRLRPDTHVRGRRNPAGREDQYLGEDPGRCAPAGSRKGRRPGNGRGSLDVGIIPSLSFPVLPGLTS